MYKLSKRFTSLHGKLEVDDRRIHGYRYGMTQEGLNEIGDAKPHLGGATHIFVKINGGPSNAARFFTRNNQLSFVRSEKPESGWADYNIEHGSGYQPDLGQIGWWNVEVDGAPSERVEDIGLPFSEHISTFLVFDWVEGSEIENPDEGPEVPEQLNPSEPPIERKIVGYLYSDGTWERI